jgi:hypothetical protein
MHQQLPKQRRSQQPKRSMQQRWRPKQLPKRRPVPKLPPRR